MLLTKNKTSRLELGSLCLTPIFDLKNSDLFDFKHDLTIYIVWSALIIFELFSFLVLSVAKEHLYLFYQNIFQSQ